MLLSSDQKKNQKARIAPKKVDSKRFDPLPFIADLVYALHIPLNDAWDFSFPEYHAIIAASNPDKEKNNTVDFDDDELAKLEWMKTL